MGRHSASYIAARRGLCTGPTAAGAAKYVGRVGALALALGVGAAVAGGTGLANADGTTDNDAGGAGTAKSSPSQAATKSGPTASATDDGPSQAKTATIDPRPTADAEPDSLGGLIARIPGQLAAVFGNGHAPTAAAATPAKPTTTDSPTSTDDPDDGDRPSGRSPIKDRPSAADDPVATVVRAATDDLATAVRGGGQPVSPVPSPGTDTTRVQRITAAPSTAVVPLSAKGFSAPTPAPAPSVANPIATVVSSVLSALGFSPSASAGDSPGSPIPFVLGALQLLSREIERLFTNHAPSTASFTAAEAYANAHPANAIGTPTPDDEVATEYGDIGTWMLESDGQISDYGGQPYQGRKLLEPVNVIIVDPSSTSKAEATQKLNNAMFWAGFPAQPIHSTGFQGTIDDVTYGQQPTGLLSGFSNNFFVLPNDHGRIFGPDPVVTGTGEVTDYVWSGAFSTETLTIYNFLPGHAYVSSDMARTALATQLILSGQATFVGMVPLDNAYNTEDTTTGDHDGYAVVLALT